MIGEPAPSPLNFATPSGDPGVTHPSVVHAPGGFAGYPYWLALTPYNGHNDADENPCIYRSHDGNEWAPISGNPIAPTPAWGHHSDTYLLLDGDALICVWRISSADNGTEILYSSTIDGETWTAPTTMWRDAARFLLSPSIVAGGRARWHMFTVERIVGAPNVVRHHVADTLTGPWIDAPCSGLVAQPGREAWHLNVVRDATGTWHALLNDTAHEVNGSGGGLFHATSTDGEAWVTDLSTCIPTSSSWHSSLYQGASVPTESGLDAWYSSRTPAWRIGRTSIAQPEPPPPTTGPAPEIEVRLPVAPTAGQAYPMRVHVGDNAYVGQATIDPFMQGDGIVTFGVLASAHVPFIGSYSEEVLADSPLAYYRFDDASKADLATMSDSSGNGNDGRYRANSGAVTALINDGGDAVDMPGGSNSRMEVLDAAWLDISGDVSVEAWIKPDSVTGIQDAVARWELSDVLMFILGLDGTVPRLLVGDASSNTAEAQGTTTISTGTTYHLVGTYNSTTGVATIYVNGSSEGTDTKTGAGSLDSGDARLGIGARINGTTGSNELDGVIDEVAIYDSCLSAARVAAHYSAGTA